MKNMARQIGSRYIELEEDREILNLMSIEETFHFQIDDSFPLSKYICLTKWIGKYNEEREKAMNKK